MIRCASSERTEPIRLSKLLSKAAGVSRREAERWIVQGDVTLFGQVVRLPQQLITEEIAPGQLQAHGKPVLLRDNNNTTNNNTRVILVHKMAGELVADSDPQGRPCVMHRLKRLLGSKQHFKAVGRLDMMTEGLLILTNDGMYAREMEMSNLHRTYRVRVHGRVSIPYLQRQLQYHGLYRPMKVALASAPLRGRKRNEKSANTWLEITCSEGKNRQVRKVLEQFGLTVTRLIRVGFGDFHLHNIPAGSTLEVPMKPIEQQKRQGSLVVRKKAAPPPPNDVSPVEWVFPETSR
ncbi:23S rRNA pseudouridine2605 synthase [Fistulifera solaris]|uniref:23S rRNA pseudouridine2605 synthase n=1 Tax=Fistulifera solaris TaxID=1519565 RepID=A0A1Z5JJI3_FISSO|nr:23S rRNA pseudouridine2605 synthase [Fistulifera solaris]|eukprot:GAX14002.1 23S rRNA pseudouridine2605 synthase [Fistulifera solaris]